MVTVLYESGTTFYPHVAFMRFMLFVKLIAVSLHSINRPFCSGDVVFAVRPELKLYIFIYSF